MGIEEPFLIFIKLISTDVFTVAERRIYPSSSGEP